MLGSMDASVNGGDLRVPLIEREASDEEWCAPDAKDSQEQAAHPVGIPSSNTSVASKHSIAFGPLVFLIYYNIGVPFGDEEAVKAAGPFMVTLGFFVILPLVWQLPMCLVTAELTTALQDHRGSIAWVSEAFGAKWGFVDAVWSLATSFLDNALYPIIISDFLGLTGSFRWAFIYACIVVLTWAVYRGSSVVASAEEVVFLLTMLPLTVMVGAGLFHMDWSEVATPPALSDVDWKLYIQIMFWTSTYWQKVASVGPDVKDCAKNFPRAILYATAMQTIINGVIHMVASGATDPANYPYWEPGYLRHAADAITGGRWLGAWLTVTAAIANSGSFLSEMSVTSQTLIGMAERGLLPRRLKEESVHGTYPWALGTIALIIALSQPLNFHALVLVCNFLYTLQTALELAAFYRLRTAMPGLRRPYRIPCGWAGVCLALGLPGATLVAVTVTMSPSAAALGTLIASATLLLAHLVLRTPAKEIDKTSGVLGEGADVMLSPRIAPAQQDGQREGDAPAVEDCRYPARAEGADGEGGAEGSPRDALVKRQGDPMTSEAGHVRKEAVWKESVGTGAFVEDPEGDRRTRAEVQTDPGHEGEHEQVGNV